MVKGQKPHPLERTSKKSNLHNTKADKLPSWVLIVSITSALAFLVMLMVIAIFIPRPTPFQMFVFRVLLSLAGAAFGATISGSVKIKLPLWGKGLISAGGALALFVLIYSVDPPHKIVQPVPPPVEKQSLSGIILDQNGEPIPGVTITIPEFGLKDITNNQGAFFFEVKAEKNGTVRLMAQKEGFATLRKDSVLGTKGHTFKMERRL